MKPNIDNFIPCESGHYYYKQKDSFTQAWEECKRGDWMLWLAHKLKVDHIKFALAKGLIANTVRHMIKNYDDIDVILSTIEYGAQLITPDEYFYRFNPKDFIITGSYATRMLSSVVADSYMTAYYAAKMEEDLFFVHQEEYANICRNILTDEVFKNIYILK